MNGGSEFIRGGERVGGGGFGRVGKWIKRRGESEEVKAPVCS